MILLYEKPRLVKLIETESKTITRVWGRRKNGKLLFNEHRISVWDDDKVMGMDVYNTTELYILK